MTCTGPVVFFALIAGAICTQPNIIVIIADDMGWNDVGFHGSSQIPTPNIDALAYNGIILNHHYTLPTCTPSRTAYLTGKYPIRTGMQGFPLEAGEPRGIPLSETLLPEILQQQGYVTRLVGKWHVGAHRTAYTPTRRGFDSHFGYWSGYIGYFDHGIAVATDLKNLTGQDFYDDLRPAWELRGRYATDLFTEEAVRLIREHDTARPLYLHMAHLAVHSGNVSTPLEVPDPAATSARFGYIQDPDRRIYAGMMASMDDSVGSVVSALADKGILNNSIILFMSDNGAPTLGQYANTGSNWPLRGVKGTVYEGAVRTACAIWSPLFGTKGTVFSHIVHISDWFPTFYSAAGGNVSDLGELDGMDQWPLLLDQSTNSGLPRRQVLVHIDEAVGAESIIQDNWKLVRQTAASSPYRGHYGDSGQSEGTPSYDVGRVLASPVAAAIGGSLDADMVEVLRYNATIHACPVVESTSSCDPECLFNLQEDPCEIFDVASKHMDIVGTLTAKLDHYRALLVPQTNQPIDPCSDPAMYNGTWVPWLDYVCPTSASPTTIIPLYLITVISAMFIISKSKR